MSEWISVKDRLPDKTGRYLVLKNRIAPDCLGGNRTDIVILRFFVDKGFRMPTHIPDWIDEEINEEVTHWMPLPEPAEEGKHYENCHGYSGNKKAIYREAILAVKSILHSEKPIDAVPVVRCRDCKHAWIHPCGYVYCHRDGRNAYEMTFDLDSFCSYGERKEGTNNES